MNNNMDDLFPKFQRSIEDLIEDEEGNIPGKKLLVLGTLMVVLGSMMSTTAYAKHRSHRSHRSHSSHRSGSHGNSHSNHGSHESHVSHSSKATHSSHSNHSNHSSHSSHSNVGAHSNSKYSAEGDVKYLAPPASKVPGISTPVVNTAETFRLPNVNENIEVPNGTPTSSFMPSLAVPASTVGVDIDATELHKPASTENIQ